MGHVVGAVEGEVAQGGELGLNAVEPGAVGRGVGDLHVVGRGPVADPGIAWGWSCVGRVVDYKRNTYFGRVQVAQVAGELQERRARLGLPEVTIKLVFVRVQGGDQMPDPMWAGVGGPPAWAGLASGVLVLAAPGGPLLVEHKAQALVAAVLDHPLGDQEVGQFGQAPGRKRQVNSSRCPSSSPSSRTWTRSAICLPRR
jgi:hypothetical protein